MSQVYMILKNILAWDDMYRERCTVGHWIQLIVMLFWLIWPSRNLSATTMSSSKSSVFGVLKSVRKAYQLRYKCSLEEDLAQHTNGDIRKLLVALVTAYRCDGNEINVKLANSEANILQDAIKDKCFNHEEIIRILSTRSKTQLMATFNKYRDDHGNSISKNFLEDGALMISIRH